MIEKAISNAFPQGDAKRSDLVRDVAKDAQKGIGKPERLKYFDKQVYSRRVNRKDRMVYIIYEETKTIDISSFRGHYE